MSRKTLFILCLVGIAILMGDRIGVAQQAVDDAPIKLPLCEVLTHPKKYSGRNLIVTARFTATKEGTNLWDHGCPSLGVDLLEDPSVDSHPDMVELYRMLKDHGLSDHPVTAMVTGQFKDDQYDSVRDRRRRVFIAVSAAYIRQTKHVERRNFRPSSSARPAQPTAMDEKHGSPPSDSSLHEVIGHAQSASPK